MNNNSVTAFATPILFIVFNRPSQTKHVFEAIRSRKPTKLYIAADGPRPKISEDKEKCSMVRDILSQVDWACQVETRFQDENLGCKEAVSGAIDWFFEHEEEGIILEDDCLPSSYFFEYAASMLERYRENDKMMHIGGINYQPMDESVNSSYYFSNIPQIWGWATWRRAWKCYDRQLSGLQEFVASGKWRELDEDIDICYYWIHCFYSVWCGKLDTWDYQWWFSVRVNNGLSILPSINLIENIGFTEDATHTKKGFTLGLPTEKEIDVLRSLPAPKYEVINPVHDHVMFKDIWHVNKQNVFFLFRPRKLLRSRYEVRKMIKEIVGDAPV